MLLSSKCIVAWLHTVHRHLRSCPVEGTVTVRAEKQVVKRRRKKKRKVSEERKRRIKIGQRMRMSGHRPGDRGKTEPGFLHVAGSVR